VSTETSYTFLPTMLQ